MLIRTLLITTGVLAALSAGAIAVVTQPLVSPIPSQAPPVDAARLRAHVKYLSVDLYPRSFDQRRNIDLAAAYIRKEFEAAGASVSLQDVLVEGEKYQNVIARFGPASGEVLVIGAHYDSHGEAGAASGVSRQSHTPGADDNASGVAGLIELARMLGRGPQRRPIELVAYTLEEPPHFRTEHMGSAWHARALKEQQRNVKLMVSLEMIGYFSDAPGSQRYPQAQMARLYGDQGNFIALVGKLDDFGATRRAKALMTGASDLPVASINAPPAMQGIDFSDHSSYLNEGYPALMVTDTAFMRNSHYHLAGDSEEKLDYARMAKVVQGVYAITQQY